MRDQHCSGAACLGFQIGSAAYSNEAEPATQAAPAHLRQRQLKQLRRHAASRREQQCWRPERRGRLARRQGREPRTACSCGCGAHRALALAARRGVPSALPLEVPLQRFKLLSRASSPCRGRSLCLRQPLGSAGQWVAQVCQGHSKGGERRARGSLMRHRTDRPEMRFQPNECCGSRQWQRPHLSCRRRWWLHAAR